MEVKIRVATKNDAAALLEIYSYYVKNTAISFEYEVPSLLEFENRICTTLQNYPYLIAEIDGKIAGYVYASRFGARAAYDWVAETSIYIHKDFHRKGLGKLLYQKLEEILSKQNVTNLYAGIADPIENEDEYLTRNSERFHSATGYKTVARFSSCGYKFGRWYSLIYMEKIISEHKTKMANFIPFSKINTKDFLD